MGEPKEEGENAKAREINEEMRKNWKDLVAAFTRYFMVLAPELSAGKTHPNPGMQHAAVLPPPRPASGPPKQPQQAPKQRVFVTFLNSKTGKPLGNVGKSNAETKRKAALTTTLRQIHSDPNLKVSYANSYTIAESDEMELGSFTITGLPEYDHPDSTPCFGFSARVSISNRNTMLVGISKGPPGPRKFVAFKGKPELKGNEKYKARRSKEAAQKDWEDRGDKFKSSFMV
ncbi:hypothetical protein BDP27DRAFT_1344448 [Rhodocollybia butyracea]|uniref:Uncharacterized protein n=1 Tax=Rhodocollybia butyracea TaxID=206335 RepID=A0A9P5P8H9_9AGAR|nr:hypothetical protein BDP27DRAFT_1344448 [Rhodocollybia butyracea]